MAVAVSAEGLISWSMLWVYLVANLAGGATAALVFRVLNPADLAAESTSEATESIQDAPIIGHHHLVDVSKAA